MSKAASKIVLPAGTKVPNHIAMILDGNRRWARSRGLKPWEGHYAGYNAIKTLSRAVRGMGVHTFTVWAFSTENWGRPKEEVDAIMNLFRKGLKEVLNEALKEKVRLIHIGRKDRLPKDLVKQISEAEDKTRHYDRHIFNFAVDYGGHDEILRAVKKIIDDKVPGSKLDSKLFESYLDTASQTYPYVDLFIRTSGEQRTSGLFPWQMDYAEYYFEQEHLPDFTPDKLREAVLDFSRRRRRFGANDIEEHLKFNAGTVADLELRWRHQLVIGPGETFRDLVIKYVKEHYGLSKDLAKQAGSNLAKALIYGKEENWDGAKRALEGLYKIIQKTLKLAFEPDVIAKFEVDLWKAGQSEEGLRQLIAEKFRFSTFQASKSAHLAYLANVEMGKQNWEKAKGYLEKFYGALKERVA